MRANKIYITNALIWLNFITKTYLLLFTFKSITKSILTLLRFVYTFKFKLARNLHFILRLFILDFSGFIPSVSICIDVGSDGS